jgi:hypothetical protein
MCQYNLNVFNFQLDCHLQWLLISCKSKDVCLWIRFEHIMFFSHEQLYVVCSQTIQFVWVGEIWDNKKYCTLCCIKGLILFLLILSKLVIYIIV